MPSTLSPRLANERDRETEAESSSSNSQTQSMAGIVQAAGTLSASRASLLGATIQQHQAGPGGRPRQWSLVQVRAETTESSKVAVNPSIKKDVDKVVDTVVVGDLTKPLTAYCRCWRSGTFPLCDGTHAKYNKETGDNLGPLLVKK